MGGFGVQDGFPSEVAFGFGLFRVEEGNLAVEGLFEDLDELGGEGDFGDEEDGGFAGC